MYKLNHFYGHYILIVFELYHFIISLPWLQIRMFRG